MTAQLKIITRDVGAVVYAIRILRHIASTARPQGVAAVARATGISPSTTFNTMRTLVREKFLALDPTDKTYSLGIGMAELVIGLVGHHPAELIQPEMQCLAETYGVLIALWQVVEHRSLVLVGRAHGRAAVRIELRDGQRLPFGAGAVGRAQAYATNLSVAELRGHFGRLVWQQPMTFDEYAAEVRDTGTRGWAIDQERLYRGLTCLGAVVTDRSNHPVFGLSAVSIAGQHSSAALVELGEELRKVANHAGAALYAPRKGAT